MKSFIPEVNLLGLFAAKAAYSKGDEWLFALIDVRKTGDDPIHFFEQAGAGLSDGKSSEKIIDKEEGISTV